MPYNLIERGWRKRTLVATRSGWLPIVVRYLTRHKRAGYTKRGAEVCTPSAAITSPNTANDHPACVSQRRRAKGNKKGSKQADGSVMNEKSVGKVKGEFRYACLRPGSRGLQTGLRLQRTLCPV